MNVRLVEGNREKAEHIANHIDNILVINADGTDMEFLTSENIQEIDSFITVTENEQTNILSGLLAHHFGVKQAIIHVSNTEFLPIIQELGIGPSLVRICPQLILFYAKYEVIFLIHLSLRLMK